MGRQDQYLVTLIVDGRPCGVFDSFEGGEADSDETKHRPGGMGATKTYGGPTTVGNVTVTRVFERDRDGDLVRFLMARRGLAPASVSRQPLDRSKNPWGRPFTYSGTLKAVTLGDVDSNSSDPDNYTVEISTEGDIA
jgi:hypothetical protein